MNGLLLLLVVVVVVVVNGTRGHCRARAGCRTQSGEKKTRHGWGMTRAARRGREAVTFGIRAARSAGAVPGAVPEAPPPTPPAARAGRERRHRGCRRTP